MYTRSKKLEQFVMNQSEPFRSLEGLYAFSSQSIKNRSIYIRRKRQHHSTLLNFT